MPILASIPAIICFLALAAHFVRDGSIALAIGCLAIGALLLSHDKRIVRIVQVVLGLAAVEWFLTTLDIMQQRQAEHREWLRAALILLGVAAFNLISAALLKVRFRA